MLIIPYLGIPNYIDSWLVVFLVCGLLYSLYRFVQENEIHFVVPEDDPDDFLNQHNVIDGQSPESEEKDNEDSDARA